MQPFLSLSLIFLSLSLSLNLERTRASAPLQPLSHSIISSYSIVLSHFLSHHLSLWLKRGRGRASAGLQGRMQARINAPGTDFLGKDIFFSFSGPPQPNLELILRSSVYRLLTESKKSAAWRRDALSLGYASPSPSPRCWSCARASFPLPLFESQASLFMLVFSRRAKLLVFNTRRLARTRNRMNSRQIPAATTPVDTYLRVRLMPFRLDAYKNRRWEYLQSSEQDDLSRWSISS